MKVAELFAALGFKIEGADKLDRVDRGMDSAARSATKATLGVTALTTAFLVMIDTSTRAAMALRNFALSTGLSTDELQLWQHAAQVNGISADALTDSIKSLQDARASFVLGEPKAIGAWQLLGVNPLQDPFKVLGDLRQKMLNVGDVGIARNLLSKVGLEAMLPLLRSTDQEFEKWNKNFIVTQRQVAQLSKLNAAWQNLKTSVIALKVQFAEIFTPALLHVASALQWVAEKGAVVLKWLHDGGFIANLVRWALEGMAVALLALAGVMAIVVAALGALATALGVITLLGWASGVSEAILLFTTLAAVIAGLVLLIDDMWHALSGGKSVLADLGNIIFGPLFTKLFEIWDAMENVRKKSSNKEQLVSIAQRNMNPVAGSVLAGYGGRTVNQENNVEIHVDGSQDPRATGRAVGSAVKAEISNAAYQLPVGSY